MKLRASRFLDKKFLSMASVILLAFTWSNTTYAGKGGKDLVIHIQNVTKSIVLTPPLIAATRHPVKPFFSLGQAPSSGLALMAEGGDTSELSAEIENYRGARFPYEDVGLIHPGETLTVTIPNVRRHDVIHFGSMLLPTNDAFAGLANMPVRRLLKRTKGIKAYDAGSEINSELCADIPGGGDCAGVGYLEEGGEGIVHPHAGIHGEGDLSVMMYNWGSPVAIIKAEFARY